MYPKLNYNEKNYALPYLDGGIAIDLKETQIDENRSPDMLNMIFDGSVLRKREGQQILFSEEKDIISCYEGAFYNYIIYHTDDKIKAYSTDTNEITVLMIRLSTKEGVFFSYNGYVYYIGSGDFYKISYKDGSLSCETVEGYIPTVIVNCEADGTGDKNEEFNFLTGGFKVTYNTSNTEVVNIPYAPLDSNKKITVKWGNAVMSGKKYEVDYENGTVNFSERLAEGHNLLEITAYTKETQDRAKITNCNIYEVFGGSSAGIYEGTRVFLSGNKDYANTFYYSGLKNPEYFPVNQFEILGDTLDPISCMGKQYSYLVIFKEKSAYLSCYTYQDSKVNFTVSLISDRIGCDCPKSLVSIDNQLTWINSIHGVMTLSSTGIKDEKNIKCISENINGTVSEKALLNQENIKSTLGFVNRGRYYLLTGKYTYVLNMKKNFSIGLSPYKMSWFIFDNINGSNCFYVNKEVYIVFKNNVTYFSKVLYDFDKNIPINAYISTKVMDFGLPGYFKYINSISFYLVTHNNSYFKLSFRDENGEFKKKYEYRLGKFNFINFSFSDFTFYSNLFSVFLRRKVQRRKCNFFTVIFENCEANSQMAISDILINYHIERGAKINGI